jgi:hypothetical protein
MELDRASRYVEVFVCLAWVVVFHLRIRSIPLDAKLAASLRRAIRPIWFATFGALGVATSLWLDAGTQPYAHALTISSLVVAGMAGVLLRKTSASARTHTTISTSTG